MPAGATLTDRRIAKKRTVCATFKQRPVNRRDKLPRRNRERPHNEELRAPALSPHYSGETPQEAFIGGPASTHDAQPQGSLDIQPAQGKAKKSPKLMGATQATARSNCFVMVAEAAASCQGIRKRWTSDEVDVFLASKNVLPGHPAPVELLATLQRFLGTKGYAIDAATYRKKIALGQRSKVISDAIRRVCLRGVFHVTTIEQNYRARGSMVTPTPMQHMTCIHVVRAGTTLFFYPDANGCKWRDLKHLFFVQGTVLHSICRVIRANTVQDFTA
ncbi:hypothetical protein SPRG_08088 [Saprolegnia parasitica CBS 223.65]|uniref:Uncharacterized protein n=1 Tax=Saprolegnia parasitica (strain CBS 223.65) TaxID=695850 RepID=A0A067C8H9_SAPPC|nr:hypothetical protein SPRG_08088 [Saprolegnia parasitica CBS 223.65]KDO26798.1 hypothetical protein SPRG_08088 [Saprolegnia parasitica CBS 223.65]|eukprot:XP_012202446.1 hypothetical protein SPRG_08088 [Saprolegnia parasitica CBS 223.65]